MHHSVPVHAVRACLELTDVKSPGREKGGAKTQNQGNWLTFPGNDFGLQPLYSVTDNSLNFSEPSRPPLLQSTSAS